MNTNSQDNNPQDKSKYTDIIHDFSMYGTDRLDFIQPICTAVANILRNNSDPITPQEKQDIADIMDFIGNMSVLAKLEINTKTEQSSPKSIVEMDTIIDKLFNEQ